MTQEEVDYFRRALELRRADVLRSLARVEQQGRSQETDCPKDPGDRSVASLSKEMLFHHSSQHRMLLRNIEEALPRIDCCEFGDCIRCGEQITLKRLQAMPFTQYLSRLSGANRARERYTRKTIAS
jgi:DnaK suppressor protein